MLTLCGWRRLLMVLLALSGPVLTLSGSSENRRIEQRRSLEALAKVDMGYAPKLAVSNPLTVSDEHVENALNAAYTNLQCNYVFGGLIRLRLTRVVLQCRGNDRPKPVSFRDEAMEILQIVHATPGLRDLNYIWWVYFVFAERTAEYVRTGSSEHRSEAFVHVLDAVVTLLEEFVETEECADFNRYAGNVDQVSGNVQEAVLATTKHNTVMARHVKSMQSSCFCDGGLCSGSHVELSDLYANDVLIDSDVMDTLYGKFVTSMSWEKITSHLQYHYSVAKTSGVALHQQIKSMGTLLDDFVRTLKAIMFRIVWKHLEYVHMIVYGCVFTLATKNLLTLHSILYQNFLAFAEFLSLQNDQDVRQVAAVLKPKQFVCKNITKQDKRVLRKALKRTLPESRYGKVKKPTRIVPCCGKFVLDSIAVLTTISQDNSLDVNEYRSPFWMRESTMCAEVFVAYIKRKMLGINFAAVQTFIGIQSSNELQCLMQLEERRK